MKGQFVRLDTSAETLLVWCKLCTLRELFPVSQRAEALAVRSAHSKEEARLRAEELRRAEARRLAAAPRPDLLSEALSDILGTASAPMTWSQLVGALDARGVPWSRCSIRNRLEPMIAAGHVVGEGGGRGRTYSDSSLSRGPSLSEGIIQVLRGAGEPLGRTGIYTRLDQLGVAWTVGTLKSRLRALVVDGSLVTEGPKSRTVYRLSERTAVARAEG